MSVALLPDAGRLRLRVAIQIYISRFRVKGAVSWTLHKSLYPHPLREALANGVIGSWLLLADGREEALPKHIWKGSSVWGLANETANVSFEWLGNRVTGALLVDEKEFNLFVKNQEIAQFRRQFTHTGGDRPDKSLHTPSVEREKNILPREAAYISPYLRCLLQVQSQLSNNADESLIAATVRENLPDLPHGVNMSQIKIKRMTEILHRSIYVNYMLEIVSNLDLDEDDDVDRNWLADLIYKHRPLELSHKQRHTKGLSKYIATFICNPKFECGGAKPSRVSSRRVVDLRKAFST